MIHDYIETALTIGPIGIWVMVWTLMALWFAAERLRP